MFERNEYTPQLNKIIMLAEREARARNMDIITSELLLLAIIQEGQNLALTVLKEAEVDIPRLRKVLEAYIKSDELVMAGSSIDFSMDARVSLENARKEAIGFGDNRIGAEHLLLGIIANQDTRASEILLEEYELDLMRAVSYTHLTLPTTERV